MSPLGCLASLMVHSLLLGHSDPTITYLGTWVVLPTAHFTTEQNATATFDFNGSLVSIAGTIGIVNVDIPSLSCLLDGRDNCSYTFDSERTHTLYSSAPLQEGHHTLSITLLTNASILSIEGILVGTNDINIKPFSHTSWTRHRIIEIVCGVLAGVLVVAILLSLLFIFIRRRRKQDIILNSMGPLRVALPTTKEAFTGRNCSTYGLSFSPHDPGSTDKFTQLPPKKSRSRLKRYSNLSSPLPVRHDTGP
ncbi:hypothetical protein AX15_006458 [Amanita polypyramis BW_CC]|nr:hypothetical protein AX15_006458 [Amanita polypyramis BW_CC]